MLRTLTYILAVYSWIAAVVLIVFLGRIAYFYERTSGQRTGYLLLVIPALLLIAGAGYYLVRKGEFTGEPLADLLLCGGGVLLSILGYRLHTYMTGERS